MEPVDAMRTAHPYEDVDVIDARAPRFNQSVVASLCGIALLTGLWPLASVMGVQLVLGLLFGRRWCLPCVFYFEVIQRRFGEGEIEDARPPRFANILGASALVLATGLHVGGAHGAGWLLIGAVAFLAALAAATGLCVGCSLYRFRARLRGIRPGATQRIDLDDLGAAQSGGPLVVQFTHPLCTACRVVESRLRAEGNEVLKVDISERRELATKYHIAAVPAAFAVDADGTVVARVA
jgi:hypothetical protein